MRQIIVRYSDLRFVSLRAPLRWFERASGWVFSHTITTRKSHNGKPRDGLDPTHWEVSLQVDFSRVILDLSIARRYRMDVNESP